MDPIHSSSVFPQDYHLQQQCLGGMGGMSSQSSGEMLQQALRSQTIQGFISQYLLGTEAYRKPMQMGQDQGAVIIFQSPQNQPGFLILNLS